MKKNIKNLLLIMIVLFGAVVLTGCKDKYKYPSETPKVTNPSEVFLNVGGFKVTKEQMYYRNMVSYGVEVLNDLIDDALLPKFTELTAEEKADYEEFKNEKIYLTNDLSKLDDEEKEDALKTFKKSQLLKGAFTDEEIEEALKLEYRRYVFAANKIKKQIAEFEPVKDENGNVIQEEYFTELQVENAVSKVYPDESKIILLTFRSELEAKSLMEAVGIYVDAYDYRGWHKLVINEETGEKTAGDLLTQTEVYDAFIKMYNILYAAQGCSIKEDAYKAQGDKYVWDLKEHENCYNNFEYTYNELSAISSTIAKKVFDNLTTKNFNQSYTIAPNQYLTKYFLAIELEEKTTEDKDASDKLVEKQLIETKLSAAVIQNYLYENRLNADLVIYDRGLEILYTEAYASAMEAVSSENVYEKTKLTSKTNVATLQVNGKEVAITADALSDAMNSRYGVSTGIGYVSQAILLADKDFNKVFNLETGEILDQAAYDELYKAEIAEYKASLEEGAFEGLGYPAAYGWANFLRDRLGVMSDLELIALGSIYDDALENLGKTTYVFSNSASIAINGLFNEVLIGNKTRAEYEAEKAQYVEAAEETIQYQMQKIVDEFYSVKAYSIKVFTDLDHNGTADELTEQTKAYGELLINYFLAEAANENIKGKTYAERLATLVKEYNTSSYNDQTLVGGVTYAEFKEQGIEVNVTTTTTYTSNKETDEELGKVLKALWNKVKDGEVEGKEFTSTVKNIKFDNELISDFYTTEYVISKVVATEVDDYTYILNKELVKQVLPSEEVIRKYEIVNKPVDEKTDEELKVSISTKEKTAIETYYKPALDVFTNEEALGDELIEIREQLVANGTMKFASSELNEKYAIFMATIE